MRTRILVLALLLLISGAAAQAQAPSTYQQPPADIVKMLDAPTLPLAQLSPDGRWLLLTQRPAMPSISDISAPMLRLAGARISPQVNGLFQNSWITNLTLVELSSNRSREISLPASPRLAFITWSPDSKHIAFVQRGDRELELWVAEAATGKAAKVTGALNATTGSPYRWLPNSKQMVALLIPAGRAAEPQTSAVPVGPNVQESGGVRAPVRTYQDLLQSQHDVALFKHYFTAQLAVVEAARAGATKLGSPAIFDEMSPSPDGKYIFVSRVVEPFSYFVPYSDFAQEAEIWDMNGRLIKKLASLSLAEKTPIGGVKTGPRSVRWMAPEPSRDARLHGSFRRWRSQKEGRAPRPTADARSALHPGAARGAEIRVPLWRHRLDEE